MILVTVEILNVGTGTDSTIGMISGNLKWGYGGAAGFIDQTTISDILSACNISRGGAFGGFQGNINVSVFSSDLVTKTIDKTVNLIGKTLNIYVYLTDLNNNSLYESQRYTGTVSNWKIDNEQKIIITSNSATAFDRNRVASVSITEEMALYQAGNSAIGKDVIDVFGQRVDYPLVFVSTENQFISVLAQQIVIEDEPSNTGDDMVVGFDGDQWDEGFDFAISDYFTKFKGKELCFVMGKWQETENSRVWVALGFSKLPLFGAAAETRIANIRRELVGRRLKVTRGTGTDELFEIEAIAWATHTVQASKDLETIWIQISTDDIADIESTGIFDATYEDDDEELHYFNQLEGTNPNAVGFINDNRFVVPYKNGVPKNNVSFVSIVGYANVFILPASCDATAGTIIGIDSTNGEVIETEIPTESLQVIHKGGKWQMIRVNVAQIVEADESSLSFAKMTVAEFARFRVTNTGLSSMNFITVNPITPIKEEDSVTDDQIMVAGTPVNESITYTASNETSKHYFSNVFHVPFNGYNAQTKGSSLLVVPRFRLGSVWDSVNGTVPNGAQCYIKFLVHAFSEGGVCLGQNISETTWEFDATTGGAEQFVEVDPTSGVMRFSSQIKGYDTESEEAYLLFKSKFDISEIVSCQDIKRVSFVTFTLYAENQGTSDTAYSASGSASKVIYPPYIGITRKASKDKIYLRALRDNGVETCTTPISIIGKMALDSGLNVDTSFNDVHAKQIALFSNPDTDTQYHPSANQSLSDVSDSICKMSMTAVWQNADGSFNARWFADDDADTATVYTFTDVIEGSFSIDKPSHGYQSTDFYFSLLRYIFGKEESVSVNTDPSLSTFPLAPARDQYGTALTAAGGWIFVDPPLVNVYSATNNTGYRVLRIRKAGLAYSLLDWFQVGSTWEIGDGTAPNSVMARIVAVAPDFLTPDGYSGARVAFQYDGQVRPTMPWTISQITPYSPVPQWRELVSGSFVSDYLTAKNIWDHAQDARKAISVEVKASAEFTKLEQPIWSSDNQAILNFIFYTVLFNTREKTVIRCAVPMDSATIAINLMDYVLFKFGPYNSINGISQTGAKGWIVERKDSFGTGTIDFTILTSISDTDALVIDEMLASAEMIDEQPVSTDFYDEGSLA